MNTLKPRTKYKIESEEQLLEIQQAAELQGYYWYVTDEIDKVGILYVGDSGVCYDPPGVDFFPNHQLLEWKSPEIDFNNAYINIEDYSVDDIMRVSKKFSKVVGKPVEGYLETRGSSGGWGAVEAGVFCYMVVNNNEVKAWLEKHPRFKLHFTPTSASWLNAVNG